MLYEVITKSDEADFDPEQAVKEIGETARLTFREDYQVDEAGLPTGVTEGVIILEGKNVEKAAAFYDEKEKQYGVSLKLDEEGAKYFSAATERLAPTRGIISIWMDDVCISYPNVNNHITDGSATITGNFTVEEAKSLANKINSVV